MENDFIPIDEKRRELLQKQKKGFVVSSILSGVLIVLLVSSLIWSSEDLTSNPQKSFSENLFYFLVFGIIVIVNRRNYRRIKKASDEEVNKRWELMKTLEEEKKGLVTPRTESWRKQEKEMKDWGNKAFWIGARWGIILIGVFLAGWVIFQKLQK
ncbi:MAG: hypothetical protein Q8P82_01265 [bacterium]|nr:hypothetical protein [bacterium]